MPSELRFTVNSIEFAAQQWGTPGNLPVLALHGWLDNCASFSFLAPLLSNLHIVALDMAGHGQSGHRAGRSGYVLWDDVADIFAVADYFGWKDFALLGHSRGAIISMIAAGTFPHRIRCMALVEGLLPEPARINDAPQQLANAITGVQIQNQKSFSIYPDIAIAIKARERGLFPLSSAAAAAVTHRGVKPVGDGYRWSTDPRLLAPSPVKLSGEHIRAFMNRIIAPTKLLLATDGLPKIWPHYLEEVAKYPQVDYEILTGGHHLHMESQVVTVAEKFNLFFAPFIVSHTTNNSEY